MAIMIEIQWLVTAAVSVVLGIAAYWLHWRWINKRMLELSDKIPGPKGLPIIGNALIFMASPEELMDVIYKLIQTYGDYVRFWLGPELQICVNNPNDIRLLLTSNKVNQKGPSYKAMLPFAGPGILTGGSVWRNHRKIANPSYNKKSVQIFSKVFNDEARLLTNVMLSKDPKTTFNIFFDVLESTTQSVCQTLMGLSKRNVSNINRLKELMLETHNMYTLIFQKMTRWWYQIPVIYSIIGARKREDYYMKLVDEVSGNIVKERQKALAEAGVTSLEEYDNEAIGIVDRYILSGELDEQEVKWETFSLFTTSQEASAKIASAVFLFLAHLPDWQEKVYNEIINVLGPTDDYVSEEDIKKLPCLDMVYKEVLRYLSIAAMIQRTVEEEIVIDGGNIILPKGTSLVIPIHVLHRDPRFWEEPNKVMPERFLPENCAKRDPNAFVPFSLGPMDCLGRVYATALIKILVVRVLRNIVFEADGNLEDLDISVGISVRFSKGYNLRAKPRKVVLSRVHA